MFYRKRFFIVGLCLVFACVLHLPAAEMVAADDQPYMLSVLYPSDAPYPPEIPVEAHYVYVMTGRKAVIGVHLKDGFSQGTGSFNLLLCYDRTFLSLHSVERGEAIADWEYFTYRLGSFGAECDEICPSGYGRLIGIRDLDDGSTPPAGSEEINGFLALLTFQIRQDCSQMNMCARIGFCSIECGDNTISDINDDEQALAFPDQNDPEGYLITFGPNYDLDTCLTNLQGGLNPLSYTYFDPGYICFFDFCESGDINLNGIMHEIGDATLFSSYFIYGPDVWDPIWVENQILATDINDDGQVLTVADLVTLVCMIANDCTKWEPPCNSGTYKPTDAENTVHLDYTLDDELAISAVSPVDVGAAAFIFEHDGLELGAPVLADESRQMMIGSSDKNGTLRVLVCSMDGHFIAASEFEMFTVPASGAGTIELIEVQFSDAYGNVMEVITAKLSPPDGFELLQNYPNPFNAATTIRFALPEASDWTLNIYNIIGRKIEEFSGHAPAGRVAVEWDATDAASGMYFYKLAAGKFTDTRKMVLMK